MEMLFSQEKIWALDRQEIAKEAWQEGRQEGIDLLGELMRTRIWIEAVVPLCY